MNYPKGPKDPYPQLAQPYSEAVELLGGRPQTATTNAQFPTFVYVLLLLSYVLLPKVETVSFWISIALLLYNGMT